MKKIAIIFFSYFFTLNIFGQKEASTQWAIELDPAPFLLNGYSISVKYSPKFWPRTSFMTSVYKSNFPNAMMNDVNKQNGFIEMKIERSYAAFAEFYFKKTRKGFYAGPSFFYYNKSVGMKNTNERTQFKTIYPNVRLGYVWYPFKKVNLYINPWFNIGSEYRMDSNTLNGIEFKPNKPNFIFAVHLGYSIKVK